MPNPNIKRLRSAKYSGSQRHYYEMNSVHATKRTPVWNQILKNRNEIAKINIPGGIHTLGNDTNTGNITVASNSVVNKELILANGSIVGTSQSFSIPVDPNAFTITNHVAGGGVVNPGDASGSIFDPTTPGTQKVFVELTIKPTFKDASPPQMSKIDILDFNIAEIITLSGFVDIAQGKAESWLNGVYRIIGFIEEANNNAQNNPDIVKNTDDKSKVTGDNPDNKRIGLILESSEVIAIPLTKQANNDDALANGERGIKPSPGVGVGGHTPFLKKHFAIQKHTDAGGDVTYYI